ncbi:MAG: hypothetical protein ACREFO_05755 [Acetobacteraceae bacterium]
MRVADGDALASWVRTMLRDPEKARLTGEAALAATAADVGLPERLAASLLALMDRSKGS